MKDFLSVNEFSKLSGIEKTTLRYWDEIGLFSPMKRDPENNYRYYSPEQVIAVHFITVLSGLNIPLKTISAIENERTPESIVKLLSQHERSLDMEMRRLREAYSIIHQRLELIYQGMEIAQVLRAPHESRSDVEAGPEDFGICVAWQEEKPLILGPPNEYDENESFFEPFMRYCRQAENLRVNLNYPTGGYHESMEAFLKKPGRPSNFFLLDPTGNHKRPAGEYLTGVTGGYYGEFGDLPKRMDAYAKKHALSLSGPVYSIYLYDEICMKSPSQYLAQVSVAIMNRP